MIDDEAEAVARADRIYRRLEERDMLAAVMEVLTRHRTTWPEAFSHVRVRRIAYARAEVMWVLRTQFQLSYPDIGTLCGGFDHTSVIAACRAHEQRVKKGLIPGRMRVSA